MKIGTIVVFHNRERGHIVTRAAVISEMDERPGFVHLTVFNRPLADVQFGGRPNYETAHSVPFGCPTSTAQSWCEAVEAPPKPTAKAVPVK